MRAPLFDPWRAKDRFRDAFLAVPEPREQTVHIARESILESREDGTGITVRLKA